MKILNLIVSLIILCVAPPRIKPTKRVKGGTTLQSGNLLSLISIQRSGVGHKCEGTVISSDVVLTAAHCFQKPSDRHPRVWHVVAGSHDLRSRKRSRVVGVRQIIFLRDNQSNEKARQFADSVLLFGDVALLKLHESIQDNDNITSANLSHRKCPELFESKPRNCFRLGCGYKSALATKHSHVLKKASFVLISNQLCKHLALILRSARSDQLSNDSNCEVAFNSSACARDRGGSLMCFSTDAGAGRQMAQVGEVSRAPHRSNKCSLPNYPVVFQRLYPILKWFKSHLWLFVFLYMTHVKLRAFQIV